MPIKTIFLDRDGVINKEVDYLFKIKDFDFIDGVFDACKVFNKEGFEIIIITNQSGIARNLYSEEDFKILTDWMLDEFNTRNIKILDVFYCPHGKSSNCHCRKPMPGMFLKAKKKYAIDMNKSWMIGDKESDIEAAYSAGVSNTIIVRSGHKIQELNTKAKYKLDSIQDSKNIILKK